MALRCPSPWRERAHRQGQCCNLVVNKPLTVNRPANLRCAGSGAGEIGDHERRRYIRASGRSGTRSRHLPLGQPAREAPRRRGPDPRRHAGRRRRTSKFLTQNCVGFGPIKEHALPVVAANNLNLRATLCLRPVLDQRHVGKPIPEPVRREPAQDASLRKRAGAKLGQQHALDLVAFPAQPELQLALFQKRAYRRDGIIGVC